MYNFSDEMMKLFEEWGEFPAPHIDDLSPELRKALMYGQKNLANVSPEDRKKLHGIIEHYRKEPHPFRACVKDNRKRFGPGTEAVCATIKDIIEGNTFWRQGIQRGEPH